MCYIYMKFILCSAPTKSESALRCKALYLLARVHTINKVPADESTCSAALGDTVDLHLRRVACVMGGDTVDLHHRRVACVMGGGLAGTWGRHITTAGAVSSSPQPVIFLFFF